MCSKEKQSRLKCPFRARHSTVIREMCNNDSLYCSLDRNLQPKLVKRNHDYCFQLLSQMVVTNIKSCDFVVSIPNEFMVNNILFNEKFWKELCSPLS